MPAHAQTSTAAIVTVGRRLLEERGMDALTMHDVADAVVRQPIGEALPKLCRS